MRGWAKKHQRRIAIGSGESEKKTRTSSADMVNRDYEERGGKRIDKGFRMGRGKSRRREEKIKRLIDFRGRGGGVAS